MVRILRRGDDEASGIPIVADSAAPRRTRKPPRTLATEVAVGAMASAAHSLRGGDTVPIQILFGHSLCCHVNM